MPALCVSKSKRPKTFGECVKSKRKAMGLTQQAVADAAGLQFQFLSRIERGVLPNPTLNTMRVIARAMGIPLAALIEGIEDMPADSGGESAE